ncbi:MAG TPA: hypothetical protein VGZ25_15240 [Gemmataceae bacterium]|nr:hypothetical protein [Gemmataceae bacterium]
MPFSQRSNPGVSSGPSRYPGTFLLAFREALAEMKWQTQRWMGDAVECLDETGEEHVVGLENLYRRARREPRETWPALITDFLKRIHEAEKAANLDVKLADVADQLMLRLGPSMAMVANKMKVWSRPLEGTSLFINLVVDQPDTMSYVTEEMVNSSERSPDEWFDAAVANLRKRTKPDILEVVHAESGLSLCSTGDAYDATRALILNDLKPDLPEPGCLVAIPSRDELLVLPLTAQALPHVHLLSLLAEKNYRSAPYSVSDKVYWVRQNRWLIFPMHVRGEEIVVKPPAEFLSYFPKPADDPEPEELSNDS